MPLHVDVIRSLKFAPAVEQYKATRTILYALGLGAGSDDLDLVYERALKALPTLAVMLAPDPMWMTDPRTGITFAQVLHGEQRLTMHRPLPAAGTVVAHTSVAGLVDKGPKGAVMLIKRELREHDSGELLATVLASAFLRADGGFAGASDAQPAPHTLPGRPPERSIAIPTSADQTLLYRLSGDFNPLHIDPAVARAAGFERPILHGLCSYGMAGLALVKALCGGDPHRLLALDARFSSPVYPGETLLLDVWEEGPGHAAFRVRVAGREVLALNNGRFAFLASAPE